MRHQYKNSEDHLNNLRFFKFIFNFIYFFSEIGIKEEAQISNHLNIWKTKKGILLQII